MRQLGFRSLYVAMIGLRRLSGFIHTGLCGMSNPFWRIRCFSASWVYVSDVCKALGFRRGCRVVGFLGDFMALKLRARVQDVLEL